jgi:hypothetical protein
MTPLYVIGGKSRTGKSKISQKIRTRHGSLEIVSTDSFREGRNDDLAWVRLVNHLRETKFPSGVLIEGVAITPGEFTNLTFPISPCRRQCSWALAVNLTQIPF